MKQSIRTILNTPQGRTKALYTGLALGLFLLCVLLSYLYRPYAYARHLSDFHLSDSYTSFLGVPLGVCFFQSLLYRGTAFSIPQCIGRSMFVLIGFEFLDAVFSTHIDWIDIAATCISGMLMYIIHFCATHRQKGRKS